MTITIAPLAKDGGPLPPVQKRPRRAETNAPTPVVLRIAQPGSVPRVFVV